MISRRTIYSLLLTLLAAGGVWAWSEGHRDECSAYLSGDTRAPADAVIESGTRRVSVPCSVWFARQPQGVQALCLGIGAGCVVFVVSAWGDWKRTRG